MFLNAVKMQKTKFVRLKCSVKSGHTGKQWTIVEMIANANRDCQIKNLSFDNFLLPIAFRKNKSFPGMTLLSCR